MEVSVIMATYKEPEEVLRKAIESVLHQTYREFEFIIILDSPDNEKHIEIIRSYQELDERIRFFVNEKNSGLTFSLNRALSLAEGKYICRMDADDIAIRDRIEKQKSYIESAGVDLIGGRMEVIDENGGRLYSTGKIPDDMEKIKKSLRYNQVIAHPTWFGKKEVFDRLEGYRQIPLCEDYDFTLRAVLDGYHLSNINETVLKYRMTSQSISRSNLFEQYLYAKYITACYKKGESARIVLARRYVETHNDRKKSEKYLKANAVFNRLMRDLEQRNIVSFFRGGIRLLFLSPSYLDKIYRFARAKLYS